MQRYPEDLYTTEDLKGLMKTLNDKRLKGVLSFSYNGTNYTFISPAQMLVMVKELQAELRSRTAKSLNLIPVDTSHPQTRRPLAELPPLKFPEE